MQIKSSSKSKRKKEKIEPTYRRSTTSAASDVLNVSSTSTDQFQVLAAVRSCGSLENLPDKTAAMKNLHWMVDRL
jgi:hypothetical protein